MEAFEARLTAFARNRRRHYSSIEELAVEFAKSRAGRAWAPGVHDLMARAVLRKNPAGDGFVLVCDPANEAGIYAEAMTMNLWPKATDFRGAVKLIGADPGLEGGSPAVPTRRWAPRTATTTASSPAPVTCCRSKIPTSAPARRSRSWENAACGDG
jgi:hypothetical protein